MIIYRDRVDNQVKDLEIHFGEENYQHLTGIELIDEDIKTLTDKPSQVLAIFSKEDKEERYINVRHVAKGLDLNQLKLSSEISEKISLERYVSKENKKALWKLESNVGRILL